jgi:outer membrane receptor protein involved in Fe transport
VPVFNTYSSQQTATSSAYAEAQIPLVSEQMQVPGVQSLTLQVANRYDSYRSIGGIVITDAYDPDARPRLHFSSSDPTVGLRFQPLQFLTLRGSYGTGFFPPGLNYLNSNAPQPLLLDFLVDPKRGSEVLGSVVFTSGGSVDLKPEHSRSKALGIVLTPLKDLRVSFDWVRIEKRDNITTALLSQDTINGEDESPGIITRSTDPSTFGPFGVGPITGFNGAFLNATRASTSSYDVGATYQYAFGPIGTLEFSANGTRLIHNRQQLFAAGSTNEYAGTIASPRWQTNASLTWSWRAIDATWSARHLDKMWLDTEHAFSVFQGSDRLPSATYHDLAVQYRFENQSYFPMLSGASLRAGIRNVFNEKPRYFGAGSSLYDTWGSPMMATYYVSIVGRF